MVAEFLGCLVGVALRTTRTGFKIKQGIFIWQVEQLLYENVEYEGNLFFRMSNFNRGPKVFDRYCTSTRTYELLWDRNTSRIFLDG